MEWRRVLIWKDSAQPSWKFKTHCCGKTSRRIRRACSHRRCLHLRILAATMTPVQTAFKGTVHAFTTWGKDIKSSILVRRTGRNSTKRTPVAFQNQNHRGRHEENNSVYTVLLTQTSAAPLLHIRESNMPGRVCTSCPEAAGAGHLRERR